MEIRDAIRKFMCPSLFLFLILCVVCVSNRFCRHVGSGGGPALASVSMGLKVILIAQYLQVTNYP
jgi:hypothetical protein